MESCSDVEAALDSLLLEVARRAAALTILIGLEDGGGIQIAESRLRRTAAAVRETASQLGSTPAATSKVSSLNRALDHVSFLLAMSSSHHREWALHRALRWFESIARTCMESGARFRESGPDLFEVKASGHHLDSAMLAELHIQACVFSSGSLQCAVFDRAHIVSSDLSSADLRNTSWRNAVVRACSFASSALADAKLDDATFVDCDLSGADLSAVNSGATARCTRFVRCDLRGTRWGWRRLERTSFVNCKMYGVHGRPILIDVCVRGVDLSRTGDGFGSLRMPDVQSLWAS